MQSHEYIQSQIQEQGKTQDKDIQNLSFVADQFSLPTPEEDENSNVDESYLSSNNNVMPLPEPQFNLMPLDDKGIEKDKNGKLKGAAQGHKVKKRGHDHIIDKSLDFKVENKTGKTIYVTCFTYLKRRMFGRWKWYKSAVYKLDSRGSIFVKIKEVDDERDRANVFGYLALLDSEEEAENSIYELLPDHKKIDLDLLMHLKGKSVVIDIEKYGIAGEFYEYDFVRQDGLDIKPPELYFAVENKTGKTIYVTCFVYLKKAKGTWLAQKTKTQEVLDSSLESRDDMVQWRFDKAPIVRLEDGETGLITIDSICEKRDRTFAKGFLAVFDHDELDKAEKSVFELLDYKDKIKLGRLINVFNKKIILNIDHYGILGEQLDYTIARNVKRIDFKKLAEKTFG